MSCQTCFLVWERWLGLCWQPTQFININHFAAPIAKVRFDSFGCLQVESERSHTVVVDESGPFNMVSADWLKVTKQYNGKDGRKRGDASSVTKRKTRTIWAKEEVRVTKRNSTAYWREQRYKLCGHIARILCKGRQYRGSLAHISRLHRLVLKTRQA